MSELYEKQALWIEESDNDDYLIGEQQFAVDEEFTFEDEIMVDEGDVDLADTQLVVEEETPPQDMFIPGSDVQFVMDEPQEEKPKDWVNDNDYSQFVQYVKDKKNKIPRHSGETEPGCERAKSFLKALNTEISQAMRGDLEGAIDENEIDAIRGEIDEMIDRLDKRIKQIKGTKRANLEVRLISDGLCKKCDSNTPMWHNVAEDKMVCLHCEAEETKSDDSIEKTAGTPVLNVYITAFERAIVGTIINSVVAGGRNIEETYDKLKNKYNFTPREELAVQQLVADYGYPFQKDRGLLNENEDPMSGSGVEFQTNYHS